VDTTSACSIGIAGSKQKEIKEKAPDKNQGLFFYRLKVYLQS
jgi:hypothetical protein